jgi:uncharacterized protein YdhG (YjbR/CyaY superfamily)
MASVPGETDKYLAGLPNDKRATLAKVKGMIRKAAPDATESFGYSMPAFKYRGRPLIYYAAAKSHCALYGPIGAALDANRDVLASYETSKGTLRFPIGKPPAQSLVTAIVRFRVKEIEAAEAQRKAKR